MAPREEDKAMEGLLRRSLARDVAAAPECPGPEVLAAYFERSLEPDETTRYELHFSRCSRCREQLGVLARASEQADQGERAPEIPPQRAWGLGWHWLAPATVMLAFLLAWFIRVRVQSRETAGHTWTGPLIAMSKPEPAPGGVQLPASPPKARAVLSAPNKVSRGAISSGTAPSPTLVRPQRVAPPPASIPAEKVRRLGAPSGAATVNGITTDAFAKTEVTSPQPIEPKITTGKKQAPASVTESVEVTSAAAPVAPPAAAASSDGSQQAQAQRVLRERIATRASPGPASPAQQVVAPAVAKETAAQGGNAAALEAIGGMPGATLIHTPDPTIEWRIASAGFVERTEDGGATWQGMLPSPDAQLLAGVAPTPKVCWLVGRNGLILLTRDAKTWTRIPAPDQVDFVGISAKDASSATVTSASGAKFSTKNAGKSWKPEE